MSSDSTTSSADRFAERPYSSMNLPSIVGSSISLIDGDWNNTVPRTCSNTVIGSSMKPLILPGQTTQTGRRRQIACRIACRIACGSGQATGISRPDALYPRSVSGSFLSVTPDDGTDTPLPRPESDSRDRRVIYAACLSIPSLRAASSGVSFTLVIDRPVPDLVQLRGLVVGCAIRLAMFFSLLIAIGRPLGHVQTAD